MLTFPGGNFLDFLSSLPGKYDIGSHTSWVQKQQDV